MSKNQMEQKVIYENMRVQASEITARQAEVVENSAKARDKVIEDAKKTRDDKIAYAIRLRMSQELLIKKKRMHYCGSESSI